MIPRPSVVRTVSDVTNIVERARTELEHEGFHMPPGLEALVRGWITAAYQTGVEAQRQVLLDALEATPEGRRAIAILVKP